MPECPLVEGRNAAQKVSSDSALSHLRCVCHPLGLRVRRIGRLSLSLKAFKIPEESWRVATALSESPQLISCFFKTLCAAFATKLVMPSLIPGTHRQGRRRELTPVGCPLTFARALWHMSPSKHKSQRPYLAVSAWDRRGWRPNHDAAARGHGDSTE